jgi:hypothetical protein
MRPLFGIEINTAIDAETVLPYFYARRRLQAGRSSWHGSGAADWFERLQGFLGQAARHLSPYRGHFIMGVALSRCQLGGKTG